jgi:hypothetical protein
MPAATTSQRKPAARRPAKQRTETIMDDAPGGAPPPAATAAVGTEETPPREEVLAGGHSGGDDQWKITAGQGYDDGERGQEAAGHPATIAASLLDPALCLAADILDDLEKVRIANENRVRQLTRVGEDADGQERGFGLDPDHPDVMRVGLLVHALADLEHKATLDLQRKLRKHPLGTWVKAQKGVGEKQAARLLAAIGDPYINSAKGAPRTVSALWAYSGLHTVLAEDQTGFPANPHHVTGQDDGGGDPGQGDDAGHVRVAARRCKGVKANWSTKAKMRTYLIAESCVKQLSRDCRDGHRQAGDQATSTVPERDTGHGQGQPGAGNQMSTALPVTCACSPYRVAYDHRRAHTAVTHPEWTDGHSHNDALRYASKRILKDLWRAARDWHQGQEEEDDTAA